MNPVDQLQQDLVTLTWFAVPTLLVVGIAVHVIRGKLRRPGKLEFALREWLKGMK